MKLLSKNNSGLKIILPIVISLFGLLAVFGLLKDFPILKYAATLIVLIIGVRTIYGIYTNAYDLFYSKEFLILKNQRTERKIALGNITKLKLSSSEIRIMGNQHYEYDIYFENEKNQIEWVTFYVSILDNYLWEFQDLVKTLSPNTVIENSTKH